MVKQKKSQKISHAFFFGMQPKQVGLNGAIPLYHPIQLNNITFIFADELSAIYTERQEGGKKMSGALWNVLKSLFL